MATTVRNTTQRKLTRAEILARREARAARRKAREERRAAREARRQRREANRLARLNTPRVRVVPYKMGSASAKLLASDLGVLQVHPDEDKSKFVARGRDTVVNWGSSYASPHLRNAGKVINKPAAVALSSNKLETFKKLVEAGVPTLDFTTDKTQVERWLDSGEVVFARTLLNSHSGRGIVQLEGRVDDIPYAPLYTLYKKKKHEYRVHVLPDGSVSIRQKRKRLGAENVDFRVRNHSGGFVFAQGYSFLPDDLEKVARDAVKALGLDFGALDVLYNENENKSYIIECNCAPGLEGSTTKL